jgi:hypothetical protein
MFTETAYQKFVEIQGKEKASNMKGRTERELKGLEGVQKNEESGSKK